MPNPNPPERSIRLLTSAEAKCAVPILRGAYPTFDLPDPEEHRALVVEGIEDDPTVEWAGAFENGELIGCFRMHAFRMGCFGTLVGCGGLGGVAVALTHKKRGVARDMVEWFVRRCVERGDAVMALYPFRQDFYYAMGWGHGTPLHVYRVQPSSFPAHSTQGVRPITPDDQGAFEALQDRYVRSTHGMFCPSRARVKAVTNANAEPGGFHSVGYFEGDQMRGSLCFRFRASSPTNQQRQVIETVHWCYESSGARAALLGFLRTQADQVQRVEVRTFDPWFHHLLSDSESDADVMLSLHHQIGIRALGIMWRIAGLRRFFEACADHRWGTGDLTVGITLPAALGQPGPDRATVEFRAGAARVMEADAAGAPSGKPDVEIEMAPSDFSSMALGVVPLRVLAAGGLANVSPASHLAQVNGVFAAESPPICDTGF